MLVEGYQGGLPGSGDIQAKTQWTNQLWICVCVCLCEEECGGAETGMNIAARDTSARD